MGRRAQPFNLYKDERTQNYIARYTHNGKRVTISTGTGDHEDALRIAGIKVAEARATATLAVVDLTVETKLLAAQWLASIKSSVSASTYRPYHRYCKRFIEWFPTLRTFTEARIVEYRGKRLTEVSKSSVNKELSALRQMLAFGKTKGLISVLPPVDSVPKKSVGTVHKLGDREVVKISSAEMSQIIKHVPTLGKRRRASSNRVPLRDYIEFLWETGLRAGMVQAMRRPHNWQPGSTDLYIEAGQDKNRFQRYVPLSNRAVEILEKVATKDGLVFGPVDCRDSLRTAAKLVLDPHRAAKFSPNDIRHARATDFLSRSKGVNEVAHLLGHKSPQTTVIVYAKPSEAGARELMAMLNAQPSAIG